MGNCLNCFTPSSGSALTVQVNNPQQTPTSGSEPTVEVTNTQQTPASGSALTVDEVINSLNDVATDLNHFVGVIKQVLEDKKRSDKGSTTESAKENGVTWKSFITSGAKFLKFVNEHTEKIEDKKDLYSGNSRVVAEILGQIGQLHWSVGGLAIAAYVIEKIDQVSENKAEALELLSNMVDLVTTAIKSRDLIPEEKMKKAVMLVVQGSIMCVSQTYSLNIFSFLKTSVNSKILKEMSNTLDHLYRDLTLAITSEIAKRQSIFLPVKKSLYPKDAVGIEKAQEEVINLLHMTPEDESPLVVVIYGFGGIGKTTLATSVVALLNLQGYNYANVNLDEDKSKNDLKKMQKVILKDAFPSFQSGTEIHLRDCQEGRDRLKEAFCLQENRPIFLYIDNALRPDDLKDLLPDDLSDLPKRSRIILTTRMLNATDAFLTSRIKRCQFPMKTLQDEDAKQILCKDVESSDGIKDDLQRILRICGGVPLALRVVRGHLVKMGYNAKKCTQILDALQKGGEVKEENLSVRLIQYVYNELEEGTKDAFLDICCFFQEDLWSRRRVEYVVGAEEVKSLEEAALLTPFVKDTQEERDIMEQGEERLKVHDIVRAKGRAMSASTRFTDVESFSEAAQDETKLKGVKGLWFGWRSEEEYVVDVKHLNSMKHSLRFLCLGPEMRTSEESPMKFKELRCLLPLNKNLRHLAMKVEEVDILRVYIGPTPSNGIYSSKASI